jgi:hypothetical protein
MRLVVPFSERAGKPGYFSGRHRSIANHRSCGRGPWRSHLKLPQIATIYLLGFSRGAFTVRVLAALILEQGLLQTATESELHDGAVKAYRRIVPRATTRFGASRSSFELCATISLSRSWTQFSAANPTQASRGKPFRRSSLLASGTRLLRTVCRSMK